MRLWQLRIDIITDFISLNKVKYKVWQQTPFQPTLNIVWKMKPW